MTKVPHLALILMPLLFSQVTQAGPLLSTPLSGAQTVTDTPVASPVPQTTLPVTGLVSGSLGKATFKVSPDRTKISYTLDVTVPPRSAIFMAHIHLGPLGENGPILFWLYGDPSLAPQGSPVPGNQFPVNDGPFTGKVSGVLTAADLVMNSVGPTNFDQAIENIFAGNTYVNVHTVTYPLGETRGQIPASRR